jgi:cation diffusion facilitator CzcD-associated flavoprotein CzcO
MIHTNGYVDRIDVSENLFICDEGSRVTAGKYGKTGPRVAVIGAGFGGIAAAVKLAEAGIMNFTVYERSGGPGGVWWDNRYPGAEVDTPTHMYSFSFKRYDWSRSHAQQAELQRYMQETIDERGLGPHFVYDAEVRSIQWDDSRAAYTVEVGQDLLVYDFVISAVGMLNVPKHPDWPGVESFAGLRVHTAEWNKSIELEGKRVAVVGTGSTAAQVVPNVAKIASKLFVFQREPGWINPKPVHEYSEREREELRRPIRYRLRRLKGFFDASATRDGGQVHIEGSRSNRAAMAACAEYIERVLHDRPDLQKLVTPSYGYFGKRPIKDSNFYPTLMRDNVELVPFAIERMTESGVVDSSGAQHAVDVVITATGFQPVNYLARLKVSGRGGVDLHDFWAGEPRAYLGIQVPEYPNFFMIYGPNTNSPTTVFFLELQAEFAIRHIRWAARRPGRAVEVRRSVFDRFDSWLRRKMVGSVWASANNYFRTESGRVVTQWPVSATRYWLLAKLPARLTSTVRK